MDFTVEAPEIVKVNDVASETITSPTTTISAPDLPVTNQPSAETTPIGHSGESKVSALSIASIKAKKLLQESQKSNVKETAELPTEPFSETDMLLQWNKYAQKLGDKGFKIMESLLLINDPTLNGSTITIELPNEGSKIDFESEMNGLLGHLRGHLHNHDITINVVVNESVENKFAFTAQDKFNRLNEINSNLEILRKTFELDI